MYEASRDSEQEMARVQNWRTNKHEINSKCRKDVIKKIPVFEYATRASKDDRLYLDIAQQHPQQYEGSTVLPTTACQHNT